MIILDPVMGEEPREALLTEIRAEVVATGATITGEDIWGVRQLAYKIRGSADGFYVLIHFESEGKGLFEITKSFNIKKDVWRFLFSRLDQ